MRWSWILAVVVVVSSCRDHARSDSEPDAAGVEPVSGSSWIHHLGLAVDRTRLGTLGGAGPAPPVVAGRLDGADVYRLGCRACHGPEGAGAPPEIGSVVGPAQGMSPAALRHRTEAAGHELSPETAARLAADAESAIRKRILGGGEKMPAAPYLHADEIDALVAYLKRLGGQPAATVTIAEPSLRVGELVARGTCHVCHDATGPGDPHSVMMRGQIPSLASLPRRWSRSAVVRKVLSGRGSMGGMMMGRRANRMPTFPYLAAAEVSAAYDYLAAVPPRP